jgi:hypothetical protein
MADLEKDAKRYRWLRDSNHELFRDEIGELSEKGMISPIMMCQEGGEYGSAILLDPHEVDKAIDEAMKRWPYDAPKTH